MNLKIKIPQKTRVFDENLAAKTRYVINSGGTRSSKTYSLMQVCYIYALTCKNSVISVCSKDLPHLKRGAIRDFQNYLQSINEWREEFWNKSESIYNLPNSTVIEFFGVDVIGKVHGSARDFLFVNEIQYINYEIFFHLAQRTKRRIFVDFNPIRRFWIHEKFIYNENVKNDITLITSTIYDNPFISYEILKTVEQRAADDENYKNVYLLGNIGYVTNIVYNPKMYQIIDTVPESARLLGYGLDFGYSNSQTAIVAIYKYNNNFIIDEMLYSTGLQYNDIVRYLRKFKVKYDKPIICDSAEPRAAAFIRRYGYNIRKVKKGADAIKFGIDIVKQHKYLITARSKNFINEIESYVWIEKDGQILNEPLKEKDHLLDAWRYFMQSKGIAY